CTHWVYPDPKKSRIPYYEMIMCAYSRSNGDIEIRIEHKDNINATVTKHYWEMKLWRWNPAKPGYNSNMGTWKLGGTRTGYVSETSPSRRIFTNCKPGRWMIRVDYKDDYAGRMPQQQVVFLNHLI